jgi:FkbM family methyltransferase
MRRAIVVECRATVPSHQTGTRPQQGAMRQTLRSIDYLFRRYLLRQPYLVAQSTYSGLRLRVKTEDVVGRRLYKHGVIERECTRLIEREVHFEPGDVLVDAGANVGWYALVLDRLAPDGVDIYAFEPDPSNYELLEFNIALNDAARIHPVRSALAETPGSHTLYLYSQKNRGRHSMLPINDGQRIGVHSVSLDEFWQREDLTRRRPGFIKMDIEGYELFALRGARNTLIRCPAVLIEYSPNYMVKAGVHPSDLYDVLAGAGLMAHEFDTDGRATRVDRDSVLGSDRQRNLFWRRMT